LRTGEPIPGIEVNGQRPDGSNAERVWITYWHPLKAEDGDVRFTGTIWVIHD